MTCTQPRMKIGAEKVTMNKGMYVPCNHTHCDMDHLCVCFRTIYTYCDFIFYKMEVILVCICVHMYMYAHTYVCICLYVYACMYDGERKYRFGLKIECSVWW